MSTISTPCLYCQSISTRGNGKTSSGTQRYRCNSCGKSFTLTLVGRPLLGEVPLTNYEAVKCWRNKRRVNRESQIGAKNEQT